MHEWGNRKEKPTSPFAQQKNGRDEAKTSSYLG
jgi:hypothetical protein